jgi:hypothetical protein
VFLNLSNNKISINKIEIDKIFNSSEEYKIEMTMRRSDNLTINEKQKQSNYEEHIHELTKTSPCYYFKNDENRRLLLLSNVASDHLEKMSFLKNEIKSFDFNFLKKFIKEVKLNNIEIEKNEIEKNDELKNDNNDINNDDKNEKDENLNSPPPPPPILIMNNNNITPPIFNFNKIKIEKTTLEYKNLYWKKIDPKTKEKETIFDKIEKQETEDPQILLLKENFSRKESKKTNTIKKPSKLKNELLNDMNKAKSIEMFLIQFKEVGILSVLGYIQKFEFDKFKLNHISLLFKNLPNDVEENLFLNFEKINLKVFFFFF